MLGEYMLKNGESFVNLYEHYLYISFHIFT
jgi:hypothetical protein